MLILAYKTKLIFSFYKEIIKKHGKQLSFSLAKPNETKSEGTPARQVSFLAC